MDDHAVLDGLHPAAEFQQAGADGRVVHTRQVAGQLLVGDADAGGDGAQLGLGVLAVVAARGGRAEFDVLFLMSPGRWDTAHVVAVIGPGDQGEPVMTIMLPEDD